jgi:hypothetical protein
MLQANNAVDYSKTDYPVADFRIDGTSLNREGYSWGVSTRRKGRSCYSGVVETEIRNSTSQLVAKFHGAGH